MRIAQVAPLFESVPPRRYGGTERVVSYLTEELVALGHEVTLFASGDSTTQARLAAPVAKSLRLDGGTSDPIAVHVLLLEEVLRQANEFDVIHWHWDSLHFSLASRSGGNHLTTTHLRLDRPEWPLLVRAFAALPLVAVSRSQRRQVPDAPWLGTVYHGIPAHTAQAREAPGGYLAFVGRIAEDKGVRAAIEIARRSAMPLRIAAKIDSADRSYFEAVVRPLLDDPLVEYVGEIDEAEKDAFMGGAYALLFPIDWPEPFGLVQIEAMARGTPVIAFRRGAVPEVTRDGVTGFVVEDVEGALRALRRVSLLDRTQIRRYFDARFTARRMATDYVALYEQVAGRTPAVSLTVATAIPVDATNVHGRRASTAGGRAGS